MTNDIVAATSKLSGETTNDYFGWSVAINSTGDTIVVGAWGANDNTGYVKVYKNISGTWTQQGAKITGEATDDYFGWSVAINSTGDTIVVGAFGANSATGYVKVYKNISGTWTQQGAKLTGEATYDQFGYSVAINSTGDTIVVGTYGANSNTGYAKVYKNISGTWTLQGAKLTGEAINDQFSISVAINSAGDTIVVGAYYAIVGGNSATGYVKVYKNISGTWTQQGAKITGEAANDFFGVSVAINSTGDTIVVGAYGANSETGYAKVYKNISGTWTLQGTKLTGEATNEYFGISVAINSTGDTIVVGACYAIVDSNNSTGYIKIHELTKEQ